MARKMTREQAAGALAATIRKAHDRVYRVRQQERTTPPKMHQRQVNEARQEGRQAIREARAELDRAIARERQEAQRTSQPTGEAAQRITMYAAQGAAMAQAGMTDLEAEIREQLAAGNQSAAREYLRAGGSRLHDHMRSQNRSGEFRTLQRAAASPGQAKRAATLKGLDTYAEQLARLDSHLRDIPDRLGSGDIDPDPDAEQRDLGRVVDLWHDTAEDTAAEAGVAEVQQYAAAAADAGVTDAE